MQDTLLTVIGGLALIIWGMNLWEIRQLRKDHKDFQGVIAGLSVVIAELRIELSHKVDKEECATYRAAFPGQ